LCSTVADNNSSGTKDEVNTLSDEKKKELLKLIEEWASQGYRTLTLAYKHISESGVEHAVGAKESLDDDLSLIAIVAIEDPLRPEVPNSVSECQRAGITVRMLTGDNILTGKQISFLLKTIFDFKYKISIKYCKEMWNIKRRRCCY
jgi:P-type E1-E2 ATPase